LLFILAPIAVAEFVDCSYKGSVVDVSGYPIRGVTVRVQGSDSIGSVTDKDGKFFLEFQTKTDQTTIIEVVLDGYETYTTEFNGSDGSIHASLVRVVLSSDGYHESGQIGSYVFSNTLYNDACFCLLTRNYFLDVFSSLNCLYSVRNIIT